MYKLKRNRWQYLTFLKLGWTKSHFLCQTWKQGHSEYMCRNLCCLFLSVVLMSCSSLSRRICSNTFDASQRTWPIVFSFQEKTFLESRHHILKFPNQTKYANEVQQTSKQHQCCQVTHKNWKWQHYWAFSVHSICQGVVKEDPQLQTHWQQEV